jgi:3-oxoadipate enol-lactonase
VPRAVVNGVDLYYEQKGSGPPLLFISGTGGDLRNRPNMFDGPLPAQFDLLSYDQRGLGQSEVPAGDYTMADFADDAAALLGHIGWDDALVAGASFGGMVAQELALRHPGRVRRLVLACTSSGGAGGSSYPLHELAGLEAEERIRTSVALADNRLDQVWQRDHPDQWASILERNRPAAQTGASAPERLEGAGKQLAARQGHDTWARLGSVACPTLVCGGRYDGIAPPENSEALARAIPGAELAMFEGGHMFLVQDRSAFPVIIRFLHG